MFYFAKFLKVALPIATAVSATVATTILVSWTKKDIEKENKDSDLLLNSFEIKVDKFEEEEIIYEDEDEERKEESSSKDKEKVPEKTKDQINKDVVHIKIEGDQKELKVPLVPKNEKPNGSLLLPTLEKENLVLEEPKEAGQGSQDEGVGELKEKSENEEDQAQEINIPKAGEDGQLVDELSGQKEVNSEDISQSPEGIINDQSEEAGLNSVPEIGQDLTNEQFSSGSEKISEIEEEDSYAKNAIKDGATKISEEKLKELEDLRDQMSQYSDKLQALAGIFR